MDLSGGPAALSGIMMGVALGAWSMGRWQGGLAVSGDRTPAAAPTAGPVCSEADEAPIQRATDAAPCQEAAQAERRNAMAAADSLGELHDEISAYRRAQKVLAGINCDGLGLNLAEARSECRYMDLMDEPTCGAAASARMACSLEIPCSKDDTLPPGPARPERMRQPSASGFTRV